MYHLMEANIHTIQSLRSIVQLSLLDSQYCLGCWHWAAAVFMKMYLLTMLCVNFFAGVQFPATDDAVSSVSEEVVSYMGNLLTKVYS